MSVQFQAIDSVKVVTTPGASDLDPFSPPSGFDGSKGEYRLMVVGRYRVPALRSYIQAQAKALEDGHNVIFEGPYKGEAADILEKIVASNLKQGVRRVG